MTTNISVLTLWKIVLSSCLGDTVLNVWRSRNVRSFVCPLFYYRSSVTLSASHFISFYLYLLPLSFLSLTLCLVIFNSVSSFVSWQISCLLLLSACLASSPYQRTTAISPNVSAFALQIKYIVHQTTICWCIYIRAIRSSSLYGNDMHWRYLSLCE